MNDTVIYNKDIDKYKVYSDGKYVGYYDTLKEARIKAEGHHWLDGIAPDPENNFGFIYLIKDKLTGMKYCGCKQYRFFESPCYSSNNMDHKNWKDECWRKSDWNFYTSSSTLLRPVIATRYEDFTFSILSEHRSKLALMKAEIEELERREVLEATLPNGDREYWNQHIGSAEYNLFSISYKIKNGYSYHPIYHTWKMNRDLMCEEWKDDPQGFCETIKENKDGYHISRRDEGKVFSQSNWMYKPIVDFEYTGVTALPSGKYRANIMVDKKFISLGHYPTAMEAAKVRDAFVKENNLGHKLNFQEEG